LGIFFAIYFEKSVCMKIFLLLTSLLLLSLNAKDTDYSIIINKPFNSQLLAIEQDYDRDITAVGFTEKFNTKTQTSRSYTDPFKYLASINDTDGMQMQLIKLDQGTGKVLLDKSSNLAKFSEAIAITKTPSNGYYIGGNTMDAQVILLKLDANANLIFKKSFGTKNFNSLRNIVQLNDGGVLAVGSSTSSRSIHDPLFETGLGLNDIFLTRFSKDGHKLWSKKYGTQYDDRGIDAVEAFDGSFIVVSTTRYDNYRDVTLMRIGENGNKIWLKHYKEQKSISPKKIIRLRDNNFLLALSEVDEMNKEQIRLIKFDLQKNVILDKKLHTLYPSVLNDIKEYADGGIVGVGYVRDASNTDALVVMLNSELKQLNQAHFGEDNYDRFNAVTILNNSQIACAGIFTHNKSQESNMWIVKLNRDTTFVQKSTKALGIYKMLVKLYAKEIKSKQIKINQDLSIEFIDKRLYFGVSKYKLTKTQKIFLDTFSKKLTSFLHQYQSQVKTLEVNGYTSSEWGKASFEDRYIKNEKLSMKRSFETLDYIFHCQDKKTKVWLTKILKGSGYSYRKKITFSNVENKQKSRRVSLRIILF